MQRRGKIDRLGLGDAAAPFEARDVVAEAGDGGAQRFVAFDARRGLDGRRSRIAFGEPAAREG